MIPQTYFSAKKLAYIGKKQYLCSVKGNEQLKIMIMEAVAQRQIYLSIPQSDYRFVSALSHKMGWTIHRERKSGLDRAIDDVRAGRVYQAESVDDLMAQLEA